MRYELQNISGSFIAMNMFLCLTWGKTNDIIDMC